MGEINKWPTLYNGLWVYRYFWCHNTLALSKGENWPLIIELGHTRGSKSQVKVSELILKFRTVIGIKNVLPCFLMRMWNVVQLTRREERTDWKYVKTILWGRYLDMRHWKQQKKTLCAHHQETKIVFYSVWYHHTCRWPSVHGTATYRF